MTRLLFAWLVFSPQFVLAAALDECLSKAENSSTTAACYGQEAARLEHELTLAYQSALRSIDQNAVLSTEKKRLVRSLLVDAQRNWARFRDLDCKAIFEAIDGTGASLGSTRCTVSRTKHRIEELLTW